MCSQIIIWDAVWISLKCWQSFLRGNSLFLAAVCRVQVIHKPKCVRACVAYTRVKMWLCAINLEYAELKTHTKSLKWIYVMMIFGFAPVHIFEQKKKRVERRVMDPFGKFMSSVSKPKIDPRTGTELFAAECYGKTEIKPSPALRRTSAISLSLLVRLASFRQAGENKNSNIADFTLLSICMNLRAFVVPLFLFFSENKK